MKAKKEAFKNWRTTGNEADKEIYKEHRKTAKISVTKAIKIWHMKICMRN